MLQVQHAQTRPASRACMLDKLVRRPEVSAKMTPTPVAKTVHTCETHRAALRRMNHNCAAAATAAATTAHVVAIIGGCHDEAALITSAIVVVTVVLGAAGGP